jgi:hypothetical protein
MENEMNKNLLNKLFWGFWCATTIFTGILAGYMVSHSIMLGRFFSWYVDAGKMDLMRQTFSVFREVSDPDPNMLYDMPLYLALVSGVIWTVLSFIQKRDRVIALIAGLSTLWTAIIFFVTDLDEAEDAVVSGLANEEVAQYFLSINVPIHASFAVLYVVSLFLLLLVAMKGHWAEAHTT